MRLIGVLMLALASVAQAQTRTMIVHLPEAPIESMGQLGDSVTKLAAYLESASPGLALEVKAFRKSEDALSYVETGGADVALVVSDHAFLLDLPRGFSATPAYRFVRGGRDTRRKLVVVKADAPFTSLADLRGRSITIAQSSGAGSNAFLARGVFNEEIDPLAWFGSIEHETDDFSATAAVVFGRTDAALISEDNPLLVSHLGKDLKEIYASRPVSMSVVALRAAALTTAQASELTRALGQLSASADAAPILAGLKIDGLKPVSAATVLADIQPTTAPERALEIAIPSFATFGAEMLPTPNPATVPFLVGFELVEVPIPSELVDAVLENNP